jgi:glucose-6-phosphate isomerase
MAFSNETMEKQLNIAQVAIDNSLNDSEIMTLLSEYGYTEEKLKAGRALYEKADELYHVQRKEYGDQFAASDELKKAWKAADKLYMRYVKVARIALKDERAAFQKLDLNGLRKKTISGWLVQAKQFFINTLAEPAIVAKLAEFGATQEKLAAAKELVEEVELANATQEREKGEAQEATEKRDAAFENLQDWVYDFLSISRIALEDEAQLIERMGVLERA